MVVVVVVVVVVAVVVVVVVVVVAAAGVSSVGTQFYWCRNIVPDICDGLVQSSVCFNDVGWMFARLW